MNKETHYYEAFFRDEMWSKELYWRMDAESPRKAAQMLVKRYKLPHNTLVRVEDSHCETHAFIVQEHTYKTLKSVEAQDINDW